MEKIPKVFIVILNWNQLIDTCDCLKSLKKLNYSNYRIVVIDNGSKDGSGKKIADRYPEVEMIFNRRNLGFVKANNQGIKFTLKNKADYVFILNNDTTIHPQMLTRLVKEAERDKKIAIIGPQIFYYHQPQILWFLRAKLKWPSGEISIINQNKKRPYLNKKLFKTDYVCGAAMLIRTKAIRKIGVFDPYFFIYWDDVDLSVRYVRAGYKIRVLTNAYLWHKVSSSATAGKKSYFLMARNQLFFCHKHNNAFIFWLKIVPKIFFQRFFYLIFSGFDNSALSAFRGMLAYFKGYQSDQGLEGIK